jgi:thiol-disulfide isomerase/thioredoxin
MRSRCLLFVLMFTIMAGNAQGLEFVYTWNKAKARAEKENKLIFVDVMADWCAPCKEMMSEINRNPEVYEFFNQNFVNYQANQRLQSTFLRNHRIRLFPTLMFMSNSGEVLHRMEGYRGIKALANEAITQQAYWEKLLSGDLMSPVELTGSFDEMEFVTTLKNEISILSDEHMQRRYFDYIKEGKPYSTAVFTHFGKNLEYGKFSDFVKTEPEVSYKIGEQLMQSFLITNNNFLIEPKIKEEAKILAHLIQVEPVQCLAYMLAFREYELMRDIGMAKGSNMQVYGRSLLQKYPETWDYELIYKIMTYLAVHEENVEFYEEIKPIFIQLANERDIFIYNDFLALIYHKTGEKELSMQQLDEARWKSWKLVEEFTSMIDMSRNRDRYKTF